MISLLKQKSKIIVERKPRKTYPVKSIFKLPKVDPNAGKGGKSQSSNDQNAGKDNNSQSIGLFNFDKKPDQKKKYIPNVVEDLDKKMEEDTNL